MPCSAEVKILIQISLVLQMKEDVTKGMVIKKIFEKEKKYIYILFSDSFLLFLPPFYCFQQNSMKGKTEADRKKGQQT